MKSQTTNLNKYIPQEIQEAIKFDKTYFGIPVKECGEKLIDVEKIVKGKKLKAVFNTDLTATKQKRLFFLRESLVEPLISVMKELGKCGLFPRFEYLYRRLEDQQASFERSVKTWKEKLSNMDKETILKIAGVFVAATPATAGHLSGAAIDLTLVDKSLKPVDMGVPYIHPGPESTTMYAGLSEETKKNRKILLAAMEKYGFANYPYEYWHFSMGDKIAARVQGRKFAIYGPVIYNPKLRKTEPAKNPEKMFDVENIFK